MILFTVIFALGGGWVTYDAVEKRSWRLGAFALSLFIAAVAAGTLK